MSDIDAMRKLSPRRNSTSAESADELAAEQLAHFGIERDSAQGQALLRITQHLYESQAGLDELWEVTQKSMAEIDRADKIACFNAKKFLSFQLAKMLDTAQAPFRRSYQALGYANATLTAKGPYPIFDNVTAIFSATPVIARTATYVFACAEWIDDAFRGKELMLEIYSRLLNPTSVSLANFIVDLEAGLLAADYLAWNFNSGMAAIDCTLSHLMGHRDVLICSRGIYGGSYQLIYDWYARPSNMDIAVVGMDGFDADAFTACLADTEERYADRLADGRKIYVMLESPCNPLGYVLDVPAICKVAHERGLRVIVDATVATPFLFRPLQRDDVDERPDFVIHSYTKDLCGLGSVIAGCVIGRNEDMFLPKGAPGWEQTMFWNVYYVKGAFLKADAAFEVIQGMRTLELRMLAKCINTEILARFLDAHPQIRVRCSALPHDPNSPMREALLHLGMTPPLFTFDIEGADIYAFQRFFDALAPTFGHMISLGQSNTIVSCPALTTHSELDDDALAEAGISRTTIRCAVGDEDPRDLVAHLVGAARHTLEPAHPGFSAKFPTPTEIDALIHEIYLDTHQRYVKSRPYDRGRAQPSSDTPVANG